MPPVFRLSNQRLNTGGPTGSLTPSLISSDPLRSLQSTKVNPDSGNVSVTDMPTEQFVGSDFARGASRAAAIWSNNAFDYQRRENAIIAKNSQSKFENEVSSVLYGREGEDGNIIPGYASTRGLEAKDTYDTAIKELTARRDAILAGVDPSARQVATLRVQDAYNNAVNKINYHRARQLSVAKQDSLITEGQTISKEVETDPERAWTRALAHSNEFKDPKQRAVVLTNFMNLAVENVGNQVIASGGTVEESIKARAAFFKAHRDEVPAAVSTQVQSKLLYDAKLAEVQAEKIRKEAISNAQNRAEYEGPTRFYGLISSGPKGIQGIAKYRENLFKLFSKNPVKAQEIMYKNYQGALEVIALQKGYDAAVMSWDIIKGQIAQGANADEPKFYGTPDLLTNVQQYVNGPLYQTTQQMTLASDNAEKKVLVQSILQARTPEQVADIEQSLATNPRLEAGSLVFLSNISKGRRTELQNGVEETLKTKQNLNYLLLRRDAEKGNSTDFSRRMFVELGTEQLSFSQVQKLQTMADAVDQNNLKYGYTRLKSSIKTLVSTGDLYYDPQSGSVGFWNMLPESERTKVRERLGSYGKDQRVINSLVDQYLRDEAQRWMAMPENKGKTYDDWFTTYVEQQPGVEQGMWGTLVGNIKRLLTWDLETLFDPVYGTEEDFEQRVEYDQTTPSVEAEVPEGTSGMRLMRSTESLPTAIAPMTIQERAIRNIPETQKSRFQNKDTDYLLGLEMIRQSRPKIFGFSDAEIENWVQQVIRTKDFETWKTRQLAQ